MKSRKLWAVIAWELILLAFVIFSENFTGHFDWYIIASGAGVAFYCVVNVIQKLKIKDIIEYEAKTEAIGFVCEKEADHAEVREDEQS